MTGTNPRLDPETRLVSKYDSTGIAKYPTGAREDMGMRVRDDFVEEHIQ